MNGRKAAVAFIQGWSEEKRFRHTLVGGKTENRRRKECCTKPFIHPLMFKEDKRGSIRGGEVINKNTISQYP